MNDLKNLMEVYNKLLDLKDDRRFEIRHEHDALKNYTTYYIIATEGTTELTSYIIIYDGDSNEENECLCCKDVDSVDLLKEINNIVSKACKVFGWEDK
jgi:hypothetical protein